MVQFQVFDIRQISGFVIHIYKKIQKKPPPIYCTLLMRSIELAQHWYTFFFSFPFFRNNTKKPHKVFPWIVYEEIHVSFTYVQTSGHLGQSPLAWKRNRSWNYLTLLRPHEQEVILNFKHKSMIRKLHRTVLFLLVFLQISIEISAQMRFYYNDRWANFEKGNK